MTAVLSKLLPYLSKALPVGAAIKGLTNANPKLANFVYSSLGAGYTTEQVIEYLRNRFGSPADQREKNRLESKVAPLPEEKGALQKRQQEEKIPLALGAAVGLGTGLSGLSNPSGPMPIPGSGMGQQPPQQQNLPAPQRQLPAPPQQGMQTPFPSPQGSPTPQQPAQAPNSSFQYLSQYSKELPQFIFSALNKGKSLEHTVALVKKSAKFGKAVDKIESDTKTDFLNLLENIFGIKRANQEKKSPENAQNMQKQSQNREQSLQNFNQKKGFAQQESERLNQTYPQGAPANSKANEDLMNELKRLQSLLGG